MTKKSEESNSRRMQSERDQPEMSNPSSEALPKFDAVVVGQLIGYSEEGAPLVDFEGAPSAEPVEGRATVDLSMGELGAEVALVFEGADPRRPIVIGALRSQAPPNSQLQNPELLGVKVESENGQEGEVVRIVAGRELELRCGRSSVVLTRSGKLLLRGTYVSSRA